MEWQNRGRGDHGRFLLGHKLTDGMSGGVFVIDASCAQPSGGVLFILQQLCKVFDYWAGAGGVEKSDPDDESKPQTSPARRGPAVMYNVALVAGGTCEWWRSSLGILSVGLLPKLLAWQAEISPRLHIKARGFNIALVGAETHCTLFL